MKSGVLIFVISILLFTFTSCHENFDEDDDIPIIDFNVDHSNYVDPFDMFNYDPIAIKQSDRKLKRKLEKDVIATKEHGTLCGEKLFLKRLVQILFSTMQLKEKTIEEGEILHIPLTASVTKRTQSVLQQFLDEEKEEKVNMIADLDEILSNLLELNIQPIVQHEMYMKLPSLYQWIYEIKLQPKDWLIVVFVFYSWILILMLYHGHTMKYIASVSFFFFLGVSWFWRWNYLYQVSTAEKQSHAMKHQQVPLACYPDQLSWFAQLRNYFSNEDPCAEYFKNTLIDSAIKISPLQAISDVLVGMVFEPSGYIGQQVGKFFYSLLSNVSWLEAIPVFVAVIFLLVVLIILMCGYEIHLPFWFKIARPQSNNSESLERSKPKVMLSHQPSVLILKVASSSSSTSLTSSSRVQVIEDGPLDIFEDCPEADIDSTTWNQIVEEIRGGSLCCQLVPARSK